MDGRSAARCQTRADGRHTVGFVTGLPNERKVREGTGDDERSTQDVRFCYEALVVVLT